MKFFLWVYILLLLISSNSYSVDHSSPVSHSYAKDKKLYRVIDSYITPPAAGSQVTAAYFTLSNNSSKPIAIISATSPMADRLELHQHTMQDGLTKMRKVSSVRVEPSQSITFKPGGYHIMWFGVSKLRKQKSALLMLSLSNGQTIEVDFEIDDVYPTGHHHKH